MIEAYLNNAVTQMSIRLIVICSCLMLVWHAIEIYRFSKTFKEFVIDFFNTFSDHSSSYDCLSDIDYNVQIVKNDLQKTQF